MKGSEVETSLVTLQGASCCVNSCWCVEQDSDLESGFKYLNHTWVQGHQVHETEVESGCCSFLHVSVDVHSTV